MGIAFYIFNIKEQNLVVEKTKKWSIFKILLYGVFLVPMLEELMFRLSMVYKKNNFLVSIFICSFFLTSVLFFNQNLLDFSKNLLERLMFSSIITFFGYSLISKYNQKIRFFWRNKFPFIFYFFTMAFAFMHFSNITEILNPYIVPILILPQILSGILIGFFRVKYGFTYGLLFHCLNNFVIMVIF